jgi:subtilisin-like proprotein convertase family protein
VRISNFAKTATEISKGLHSPVTSINNPIAPKSTVVYNFDGGLYCGTRTAYSLKNIGTRFSFAKEEPSPMFHIGKDHEKTLDSFRVKHPLKIIPISGTAGYTTDTIQIDKAVVLNENNFNVFLALNHKSSNELKIELIAPFGDSIELVDNVSNKKCFTFLLDSKTQNKINSSYVDLSPRISGTESFEKFNGKNSKGVWTLKITDKLNGNRGFLYSWGLKMDGAPIVNSTDNLNTESSFVIYPNPTSNHKIALQCSNDKFNDCEVDIVNLAGQVIFHKAVKNANNIIQLDLAENISAGSYLVRISNSNSIRQSKLIISE